MRGSRILRSPAWFAEEHAAKNSKRCGAVYPTKWIDPAAVFDKVSHDPNDLAILLLRIGDDDECRETIGSHRAAFDDSQAGLVEESGSGRLR